MQTTKHTKLSLVKIVGKNLGFRIFKVYYWCYQDYVFIILQRIKLSLKKDIQHLYIGPIPFFSKLNQIISVCELRFIATLLLFYIVTQSDCHGEIKRLLSYLVLFHFQESVYVAVLFHFQESNYMSVLFHLQQSDFMDFCFTSRNQITWESYFTSTMMTLMMKTMMEVYQQVDNKLSIRKNYYCHTL